MDCSTPDFLSITNFQSLLELMSIELVMPSNHLILCRPLLLLPSICPSIRVFSSESVLCIRWPKYLNFSFNISPSNEYSGLISFRMDWLDLLAVQGTLRLLQLIFILLCCTKSPQSCLTLCNPMDPRLFCSWDSPGKNTGVGCYFLLQEIFPTQGLNSDLPYCRQFLYIWATREDKNTNTNIFIELFV